MLNILQLEANCPRRITLVSDEPIAVILTVEEKTSIQQRINHYDKYYICYVIYDQKDQEMKLLVGLAHYSYISMIDTLKQSYSLLNYDIELTIRQKEWTFESQSRIASFPILLTKNPLSRCIFPEYEMIKKSVIAWRKMLGDKIIL